MPGELQAGSRFGRYRIERLLGKGGYGAVYLAQDTNPALPRRVALKVLDAELGVDQAFRERFLRESLLAIELDHHAHILPVYDADEVDGALYLAMRYVDGIDLHAAIALHGRLPPSHAASLITQIASALDVAHAAGLVHRDVKPGNILLNRDLEHAYLADFGLVKQIDVDSNVTRAGQFLGTLSYAAPEQIEGKTVDRRADVYALGCVLYECLTGSPPFSGDLNAVVAAHLSRPVPSVVAARPELPAAVDAVIATATAKSRESRFQSCGELSAAVTRALSPEGATVHDSQEVLVMGGSQSGPTWGDSPGAPQSGDAGAPPSWPGQRQERQPHPSGPPGTLPQPSGPQPSGPSSWPSGPGAGAPVPPKRRVWRWLVGAGVLLIAAAVVVVLLVVGGSESDTYPNDDEQQLLSNAPGDVDQDDCTRLEQDDGDAAGVRATITCEASGGADTVTYASYGTPDDLDDAYEETIDRVTDEVDPNFESDSGSDCFDSTSVEHAYEAEEAVSGRVLCYRDAGASYVVWTNPELHFIGTAQRDDRQDADLYDWWAALIGRIDEEEPEPEPPPVSDAESELLAHVPGAFADTCESDQNLSSGEIAVVNCQPSSGADFVQYSSFASSAEMNELYETILGNAGVSYDSSTGDGCPAEGTYSVGDSERGRDACWVDGDGAAWWTWTDEELLILSTAIRDDGDSAALKEFWESDAGPVD